MLLLPEIERLETSIQAANWGLGQAHGKLAQEHLQDGNNNLARESAVKARDYDSENRVAQKVLDEVGAPEEARPGKRPQDIALDTQIKGLLSEGKAYLREEMYNKAEEKFYQVRLLD